MMVAIKLSPFGLTSQVGSLEKRCLIHSDVMTIVHARSLTVADAVRPPPPIVGSGLRSELDS